MVAPPSPPPPRFMPPSPPRLPSRHFCETGSLAPGERYHPDLHNVGSTPRERCGHFYQEYAGGKRRTRRNKKSRKHRKKSFRRRRH